MKNCASIHILRPQHWIKNVLLFAPLLFSGSFFEQGLLIRAFYGFILFCSLASAAYIINDVFDFKRDTHHPSKKNRPLAQGKITTTQAIIESLMLIGMAEWIGYTIAPAFAYVGGLYIAVNIFYNLLFKNIVILDVMTLASFYVIRVWAGAVIIGVPTTPWLMISVMLLALFLGFGKRRHELTSLGENATLHRLSLNEYSTYFLDQMISIVTSSTLIIYTFYTISDKAAYQFGHFLPLTIPIVLYGLFRYLYLIHQKDKGGAPTSIFLNDKPLLVSCIGWGVSIILLQIFL